MPGERSEHHASGRVTRSVGTLLVDRTGTVLEANETLAHILGRARESLIGSRIRDVIPLELPEAGADISRELWAGERDSFRTQHRWRRADGTWVTITLTVSAVPGPGGERLLLGHVVDLTEALSSQEETRYAEHALRGVIDSLLDPWVLLAAVRDEHGRIVDFEYRDANEAACAANRRPWDELVGSSLLTLLPGHRTSGLFEQYVAVVETGIALALDDSPYGSELTDRRVRYFDNRAVKVGDGLSFTWRDVTDRVHHRQRLTRQALSDPLTGLANRQRLMDALDEACARVHASGGAGALLYCDLDGLKAINDRLGHEAGDIVLRAVGDRMRGAVRNVDLVARLGGDEFVVLAEGILDDDSAQALALKIAHAVTRPLIVEGEELLPTISTGIAVCWPGCQPQDLLRAADAALYREKDRRGRTPRAPEEPGEDDDEAASA